MARPREPIELIVAKGNKHLTKAEIEARRATEVRPCADDLTPPSYLTAKQKKHFTRLALQLEKIGIMGETDTEALARYITAEALYEDAVKDLRALQKNRPKDPDAERYYADVAIWTEAMDVATKTQDRYFKQAQAAARDLGLTISSRCKLVAPVKDEAPPVNKFSRFGAG
jgi:P27 family predicted phage terminase small subunit